MPETHLQFDMFWKLIVIPKANFISYMVFGICPPNNNYVVTLGWSKQVEVLGCIGSITPTPCALFVKLGALIFCLRPGIPQLENHKTASDHMRYGYGPWLMLSLVGCGSSLFIAMPRSYVVGLCFCSFQWHDNALFIKLVECAVQNMGCNQSLSVLVLPLHMLIEVAIIVVMFVVHASQICIPNAWRWDSDQVVKKYKDRDGNAKVCCAQFNIVWLCSCGP